MTQILLIAVTGAALVADLVYACWLLAKPAPEPTPAVIISMLALICIILATSTTFG